MEPERTGERAIKREQAAPFTAGVCPNCGFDTPVDPDFAQQKCRVCGETFYDETPPGHHKTSARAAAADKYEQIAQLMRRAIEAEQQRSRAVTELEGILAGPATPEALRCLVERVVSEWVENIAHDSDDSGFTVLDAQEMIMDI